MLLCDLDLNSILTYLPLWSMSKTKDNTGKKWLRPHFIGAVLSVSAVLFLLGILAMMVWQSQEVVRNLKEQMLIIVEINDGFSNDEIASLKGTIESGGYAKQGSVDFISKEAGKELLKEDFGDDFTDNLMMNPLYDIITFHPISMMVDQDSLSSISSRLASNPMVSDVYYQEELAAGISENWSKIAGFGLVFCLLLVLISIFLIGYSVRQSLNTDRFTIKSMQLVGATPSFIARPYVLGNGIGGICSAFIAGMGLFILRTWLVTIVPGLKETLSLTGMLILIVGLAFVGWLIMWLTSSYMVRRYLKAPMEDLYS